MGDHVTQSLFIMECTKVSGHNLDSSFLFISPLNLQKFFVKGGGMIKDYHKVTEIIPGDIVTVKTNKGSFEARKVIITAGPWGPALVKRLGIDLPFKVHVV